MDHRRAKVNFLGLNADDVKFSTVLEKLQCRRTNRSERIGRIKK